ncbi:MAG: PAS domain S-box protein [Deltaproteobacteria bacterium]|nr:PAS domain S-box protein [Deltaproteobacteria bacterium]
MPTDLPCDLINVLLVEDNPNDRVAFSRALRKSQTPYQVTEVGNPEEALAVLDSNRESFDIAVIDYYLPVLDGLQLFKIIRDRGYKFPVVLQTGAGSEKLAVIALKSGVNNYLIKDDDGGYSGLLPLVLTNEVRRHREMLSKLWAEEALEESETRYRFLLDTIPDPLVVYDPAGRITFANEAFLITYGWSKEDLLSGPVPFVPEDEDGKTKDAWVRLLSGEKVCFETKRFTKDGRLLDVQVNTSILRDLQGRHTASVVIHREITRLKQTEEALRVSEEMHRAVMDGSPDPIIVYDIEGKVVYFNAAFSRVFGWALEECRGEKMNDFVPEDSWPVTRQLLAKVLAGESFSGIETRRYTRNGAVIFVSLSGSMYRDRENKPAGTVAIFQDITARKLIEKALLENEEQFRYLAELSPFPISIIEANGNYSYVNQKFVDIFGYTLDDIPNGREFFRLAFPGPEYRDEIISVWFKDLREAVIGEVRPREYITRCQDGNFRNIVYRPVTIRGGKQFITYEDITARREEEKGRDDLIAELQTALAEVRTLSGLLPICASCKKIRDDQGYWTQIETYIRAHSQADFTHGICPDCARRLYPELDWDQGKTKDHTSAPV